MQVHRRALELSITAIVCLLVLDAANITAGSEAAKREVSARRRSDVVSGRMIDSIAARHQAERWQAARELTELKDPASVPVLIRLLHDDYVSVRGTAAWGLSQIGGQDAQDALLSYLRDSLALRRWGDIGRAVEAQNELPDDRALEFLIQCLKLPERQRELGTLKRDAAQALGKLGDSKASLAIAQQLDLSLTYDISGDNLYLAAIRDTRGKAAIPLLVEYLEQLVAKMAGDDLFAQAPIAIEGREMRQMVCNAENYDLVLSALTAITGRNSIQGSREEVSADWKMWLRRQGSGRSCHAD